jgi:hypothetical protein
MDGYFGSYIIPIDSLKTYTVVLQVTIINRTESCEDGSKDRLTTGRRATAGPWRRSKSSRLEALAVSRAFRASADFSPNSTGPSSWKEGSGRLCSLRYASIVAVELWILAARSESLE